MSDTAAIVLAAGEGTRMKSDLPKVLHPILGMPMIFHVLRSLRSLGNMPVVIVTGYRGDQLENETRGKVRGMDIRFVRQSERLGTGHAVKVAIGRVPSGSSSVLVLMGDMPLVSSASMRRILEAHTRLKPAITVAVASPRDPSGYGRITRSFSGKIIGIKEEGECTGAERRIKEINTGVYCFSLSFLRSYIGNLKNDNAKKEYYLTDLVHMAAGTHADGVNDMTVPPEEALGINDRSQAAEAEKILLERTRHRLMREGVSITMPDTVYVEESVRIGHGSRIEPFSTLKGSTTVGKGCTVGSGSILASADVGDGVVIEPYAVLDNAHVEAGRRLPPFTVLKEAPKKAKEGGRKSSRSSRTRRRRKKKSV